LKLFKTILDVNLGDLKTEVIQEQDILKKMIKSGVIIKVRNKGNHIMHNFNEDMLQNLYKQIHVDQTRKLMSNLDNLVQMNINSSCFINPKFLTDYSLIRSPLYGYVDTSSPSDMSSRYLFISKNCIQLFFWGGQPICTDDAIFSLSNILREQIIHRIYYK